MVDQATIDQTNYVINCIGNRYFGGPKFYQRQTPTDGQYLLGVYSIDAPWAQVHDGQTKWLLSESICTRFQTYWETAEFDTRELGEFDSLEECLLEVMRIQTKMVIDSALDMYSELQASKEMKDG